MKKISVVSKVSLDVSGDNLYLGGPVSYTGTQLAKLTDQFCVYAMCEENLPFKEYYEKNIRNFRIISDIMTTTFNLEIKDGTRHIDVLFRGSDFRIEKLPKEAFDAGILLLSPIVNDMPIQFISKIREETDAILIIDPFNNDSGTFKEEEREFFFQLIPLVDIIKVSDNELLGIMKENRLEDAFKKVPPGIILLVTAGSSGTYILNEGDIELVPALKRNPIDTIGCGDVFLAGLMEGLREDMTIKESGFIGGNICASFSMGKKGVDSISGGDIILPEFLRLKPVIGENKEKFTVN